MRAIMRMPLLFGVLLLCTVLALEGKKKKGPPKPRNKDHMAPDDDLEDDLQDAIQKLNEQIHKDPRNRKASRGILVLSDDRSDKGFSDFTIRIWKEYARLHGQGFISQSESLVGGRTIEWTQTRTLMHLLPAVKWKYVLVVNAKTVPNNLNKTWEHFISDYMKEKRYGNDQMHNRILWAPWDCETPNGIKNLDDGRCFGMLKEIMVIRNKPEAIEMISNWHAFRNYEPFQDKTDLYDASFEGERLGWHHEIHYRKNVITEMGLPDSSFIKFWRQDASRTIHQVRDSIHSFIKSHKTLSKLANELQREADQLEYEEQKALPYSEQGQEL